MGYLYASRLAEVEVEDPVVDDRYLKHIAFSLEQDTAKIEVVPNVDDEFTYELAQLRTACMKAGIVFRAE